MSTARETAACGGGAATAVCVLYDVQAASLWGRWRADAKSAKSMNTDLQICALLVHLLKQIS